ncbi:MAG TPA: fused MFS/spermidine synthase [Terriglobales bacterium]|nr:fused MFS/spermidine synthase [Terriglobales bacterium]
MAEPEPPLPEEPPPGRRELKAYPPRLAAALVFFASGAVLVLEIVALRLVAPYVGITLQTNSAVIGVALAAIATGAWAGGRLADDVDPRRLVPGALVFGGAVTMLTLPLVRVVGPNMQSSDPLTATALAFIGVFAPSAFLASVAPMVVKLQLGDLRRTGSVVGRLSGIGTLGAILATFVTGFVLVAALPSSVIVVGLGLLTLLIGVALTLTPGSRWRPPIALLLVGLFGAGLSVIVPSPCQSETAYHCVREVVDPARPTGHFLVLDTLLHSYVDVSDPTYLDFPYVQAIASVADVLRPAGQPISALHLGGGGLTLPRYLVAARPGTRSRVLEIDPGVIAFDRAHLALGSLPGLTIDVGDARVHLAGEPAAGRDLVVGDAFGGIAVPWHLTTREVVAQIRRILRPDGVYAVNVIDFPPNRFVRAEVATIAAVFPDVAIVADPSSLTGAGGGNFVVVASAAPLPLDALRARLAQRRSTLAVAGGDAVSRFTGDAMILRDDYAPVDQLLTHPPQRAG